MSQSNVSAHDLIEESKRRGYLAKQLYVVFTSPTNGIGPVMENLARHLEFQETLEKKGIMFAAGPHWTDDEQRWDGEGMGVIRAPPWSKPKPSRRKTQCTRAVLELTASGPGW